MRAAGVPARVVAGYQGGEIHLAACKKVRKEATTFCKKAATAHRALAKLAEKLGIRIDDERQARWSGDRRVLEALKDGVLFRPLETTLEVDAVAVIRPRLDPREILLLDPACGSMHFGLYAFDLFEVIYREAVHTFARIGSNGEVVAAGARDGTIRLWDGESGAAVGEPVVGHGNGNLGIAARGDVVDVQLACQLVDDARSVVGARPADVPGGRVGDLPDVAAGGRAGVQVERPVAVRGEVDGVADPHGVALGALAVGEGGDLRRSEIEEVEVLRPAALVALPVAEVAEEGRVDHPRAVGREVAGARGRHGKRGGQPAVDGHGVELALGRSAGVAERAEEDRAAVRRPAEDLVIEAPARRQRRTRQ